MNPLKSLKTIKSRWEFFEKTCLQGVSDQQRHEALISFYAGVATFVSLLDDTSDIESEEEQTQAHYKLRLELETFKEEQIAIGIAGLDKMRY